MNRLKCLLTGGHELRPTNFFPLYNRHAGTYTFFQRCSKCGKRFDVTIPAQMIQALPKDIVHTTHSAEICKHCAFAEKQDGYEAYYCRKKREHVMPDNCCEYWEF